MLIKAKTLKGYKLNSLDGEIGKVEEFYFDDQHWTIRYLIAETGGRLTDRQVLISPHALTAVNKDEQTISVNLTKKQIEDSPPLASDKPVSRQYEQVYYGYYGWPLYWGGAFMWGEYPYIANDLNLKAGAASKNQNRESDHPSAHSWDPNLRSTRVVRGNNIRATDGDIGHIDDFIINDENWAIRYLVVDTKNWWFGKKVLISPKWIEHIDSPDSIIFVNVVRDDIMQSPEYTEESLLTRDYETGLHQHYNRRGYWVDEPENAEKEN